MRRYESVSDAEAYTVRCPICKSKSGFTCTYMPKFNPKTGRWDPQSGKPTQRPHNERRDAWRKKQREADRQARDREAARAARITYAQWKNSIARSIRDGAMRDQAELIAWLKENAHILTDTAKEEDNGQLSSADLVT